MQKLLEVEVGGARLATTVYRTYVLIRLIITNPGTALIKSLKLKFLGNHSQVKKSCKDGEVDPLEGWIVTFASMYSGSFNPLVS